MKHDIVKYDGYTSFFAAYTSEYFIKKGVIMVIFQNIRWKTVLVFLSVASIAAYVLLPSSLTTEIYGIPLRTLPLLFVIAVGGFPLALQIIIKVLKGGWGADLLAVIAIMTAVYLGAYLAANLVILMLASGQMLEDYAIRKASSILLALANRMPSQAHRKHGGRIEGTLLSDIQIGDLLAVYPHEICPVDGFVLEGHGSMDESYLTGEPYKISKAPGVPVLSGAINGDSLLLVQAGKRAEDSRYAKIMKVMGEAEQHRPHMRRLADQLGALFTPFALIIAASAWALTDDPLRFLSILVIATPCPLLIAIPITIISAISLSAKRGIIIKDPIVLERLPLCRTVIFDKTGTLTYGQPKLVEIIPAQGFEKDSALQIASSLERYSKHPLAIAIQQAANKAGLAFLETELVSEIPGFGLSGYVSSKLIYMTNRKTFMVDHPEQGDLLPPTQPGLECILLVNQRLAATFIFRDTLRSEGSSFVRHLSPIHHFKKMMIVSGDRPSEVAYLAKELNIQHAFASQTPEQKVDLVRREVQKSPTLFVGDGINDAPALVTATVGLAFGANSITAEAGGAVILESSLAKVDELLHISTLMRRIALQSAAGGMLLSLIGMGFAAAGMIPPVIGALLQEGIDVLAILNALRLTWKPNIQADIQA